MADENVVYLPRKLGRDAIFRCKLTIQSKYNEISEKIHFYLNNEERTHFFEHSPFGNLVRYYRDFKISSQILWYLMSNQILDSSSDDLWMVVRKRPVRFSLLEYCLITGLDCAIEPEDLPGRGVFATTHFPGKADIVWGDLEGKIMLQEHNETGLDMEKIKMASLYFCCAVFGEATRKKTTKIDPKYLRLVDDLDRLNHYPWGRVAYRDAVRCLKKDLLGRYNYLAEAQGRKEVEGSFLVGGFVLPLQIFAYECYPSVAQKLARRRDVDGLMLLMMFQWVTKTWASNRAPTGVEIAAAFGDCAIDDCLGFLTPTPEEVVAPYYTTGHFVDSAPDAVITRVLELWRQGRIVICCEHPVESPSVQPTHSAHSPPSDQPMYFGHSPPSVQHTPPAHASPDVSGIRPGDLDRSSSRTSSPMRTGPTVHFGLNPSRRPSPLEHRFERRLTALDDSVTSMHVKIAAEFIDTRSFMRSINQALVDLKSSLTEQIRAGFAEMRSNMSVQEDRDYSIVYSRGRKRKASEADFGELILFIMFMFMKIASTSQTLHIFEPNLSVIIEESSEGVADNLGREIGSDSQTQQIFEPNLQAIPEESVGGEIFK
ncbi:uncharacterized protein [Primulina eburnea]|uniref:uncharacterized protein n=1 Tax=Primulina eburnea TaxID=1245227 RepID=UPI003C6C3449